MRVNVFLCFLGAVVVFAEVGQLLWYSQRWEKAGAGARLNFKVLDTEKVGVEGKDLRHTRVNESLDFDEGDHYLYSSKEEDENWSMELFHLKYEAGNRRQLKDLFDHSPEVCLGASGAKLLRNFPSYRWKLGNREHFVRHLLFEDPVLGKQVHVFKFIWLAPHKVFTVAGDELDFRSIRLRAALGRFWPGEAHQFLASVNQAADEEEAWEVFKENIMEKVSFLQ